VRKKSIPLESASKSLVEAEKIPDWLQSGMTRLDTADDKSQGYGSEDEVLSWWQMPSDRDRLLTHEMVSEALWFAVVMSAKQLRYKYFRHVPKTSDGDRRREQARSLIQKVQLLEVMVRNWRSAGILEPNQHAGSWLSLALEEMQENFQKKYDAYNVY
jgi:hypothetical protein